MPRHGSLGGGGGGATGRVTQGHRPLGLRLDKLGNGVHHLMHKWQDQRVSCCALRHPSCHLPIPRGRRGAATTDNVWWEVTIQVHIDHLGPALSGPPHRQILRGHVASCYRKRFLLMGNCQYWIYIKRSCPGACSMQVLTPLHFSLLWRYFALSIKLQQFNHQGRSLEITCLFACSTHL